MIANKEDKNVEVRQIIKEVKLNDGNWLKEEINSTIAASEIAGIPKRKENLAASPLSQPDIRAVEIVTPDLEIPGNIANAWERPIKKLSENLWFLRLIKSFFELSAMYIKIAMRKETHAIDKLERRKLLKIFGINNFTKPPRKTIGIVPIKIDLKNLSLSFKSKIFLEYWLLNLKISFLKYQTSANTLPSWINADREGPGSSIPKNKDTTFKCAVLLTGINSVKPCIKPYKINSIYSKNLYKFLIY